MKFTIFLFCVLLTNLLFGQNQFKISDAKTHKPIQGVMLYCKDELIGKTDKNGQINFQTKCKKLEVFADNYDNTEVDVQQSVVMLNPSSEKTKNINQIVLSDKSDPKALRILDELNKRYKDNHPDALPNYSFKAYSKISIDFDQDSIQFYREAYGKYQDSLAKLPLKKILQKPKKAKDSMVMNEYAKSVQNNQFFIWEKAAEYLHSKKYGDKTNVLDTRMSGLPNPMYEALALNVSMLNRIPRQLRIENRPNMRFYLADTIQLDGRNTYVIKYKDISSKMNLKKNRFNGKIYVDEATYGLKKIESQNTKQYKGFFEYVWKPIVGKWFLDFENIKVRMGTTHLENLTGSKEIKKSKKNEFGNYLYVTNRYYDFDTQTNLVAEKLKGYSLSVRNSDGSLLSKYRTDSLSQREALTYVKVDSLAKKINLDKKISFITNLLTKGVIRYKMIDFDVLKILNFNKYQAFAPGLGVKLNEHFNKTFSPDAYFNYGFGNHRFGYGIGTDFKLSQAKTSVFRVAYIDDYFAIGRQSLYFWDISMKFKNLSIDWYNANFYRNRSFEASYLFDLGNSLSVNLGLAKELQSAVFNYDFNQLGNNFNNTRASIFLKYAPNDKNMMTPTGKFTIQKKYPYLYLNYENGSKILGGTLNYHRTDFMFLHQLKSKIGLTHIKLYGGISLGNSPIWKKYEITGLTEAPGVMSVDSFLRTKVNTPTILGFTTMPSGTYYTDKFLGFQLQQNLPFRFKFLGKNISNIAVEYHSAIGNFSKPELHQFDFKVPNRLYQEVGFVWNKFLGTSYGLGFFYRLGHYQTNDFVDNLGIQLKLIDF